jgi:hypothetical protein
MNDKTVDDKISSAKILARELMGAIRDFCDHWPLGSAGSGHVQRRGETRASGDAAGPNFQQAHPAPSLFSVSSAPVRRTAKSLGPSSTPHLGSFRSVEFPAVRVSFCSSCARRRLSSMRLVRRIRGSLG